jgi:NitT/TauT family transport system substrate-binding protein
MTANGERRAEATARAAALALLLGGVAALFCSCKPGQPPEAVRRAPVPVTLGIGLEPLAASVIVAESEGFFGRRGIAATVRKFPSGKLAMDAMLAGETQLATVSETPVVFESFKRQDFRVLAIIGTSDNEARVVARKDRGVRARPDLKGRRIATQEASSMHFFLHMFLLKHGLLEKDVAITFAPPGALVGMLADGRADACCAREPIISRAVAALGENATVFEEPGLFVRYYLLVTTQRFLQENPGAVRAILRALADAEASSKAHPERAAAAVARAIQIAKPVIERVWPSLDLRLRLNQSLLLAMEDEARWTLGGGLVKDTPMPNYLQFVHLDAMLSVKPSAVSIIR